MLHKFPPAPINAVNKANRAIAVCAANLPGEDLRLLKIWKNVNGNNNELIMVTTDPMILMILAKLLRKSNAHAMTQMIVTTVQAMVINEEGVRRNGFTLSVSFDGTCSSKGDISNPTSTPSFVDMLVVLSADG